MHTVVTLISSPGRLLDLAPFVTILGQPERIDWLEEDHAADLHYPSPIDEMLRPALRERWRASLEARRSQLQQTFAAHALKPLFVQGRFDADAVTRHFMA